jgi:hypothetical protein
MIDYFAITMARKSNRTVSSADVSEVTDSNDVLSEHHTIVGSIGENSFVWDAGAWKKCRSQAS